MARATDTQPVKLPTLGLDAQEMCQALLRIDTTNPPGNERPAAEYVAGRLREVGYQPTILEPAPQRANVVCRYRGSGEAEPLLLATHLDVVEAHEQFWNYPPFSGIIAEDCLWGRGAIDMKNMVAMSAAVMRRLASERVELCRDVIFAAVADEEAGCDHGSRYLVEEHPELVRAEYALGEAGGFSLHLAGSPFYPIQVAEKGICWIRATVRGEPGHGSIPRSDSALVTLARAAAKLGRAQFPVHETRQVKDFLHQVAARQPAFAQPLLRVLSHPMLLPRMLKLLPDQAVRRSFSAILSNTASPTVFRAGSKINVIPELAELHIDGRILPGQSEESFLAELRHIIGSDLDIEVMKSLPPVVTEPIESPLLDTIRRQIAQREPQATVVPHLIPGFTDAKYFTKLGARWYGFSPVKIELGSGIRFTDMFHGHNERIPIAGLHWGAELLYDVVTEFCAQNPDRDG
ncbi:MAG: M20/M25/M40 family metallo-hydrolase [Proteobacteria bacterium]|nr:M20/M25/M40 family metallo-hydrolase [Pseudomonadota bacterium]